MKLLLLAGMSGAGKSLALKMLEDSGYETLDSIPHAFLHAIAGSIGQRRSLAVGVDVTSKDFSPKDFVKSVESLRENDALEFKLIFVDSDQDVLIRRLEAAGTKHPALPNRTIRDGIKYERSLTRPIRAIADAVIDTSEFEDMDLRKFIASHFSDVAKHVSVVLTSFSYKHGVPREADYMFDVRFLQNPHYVPDLKALTGLETQVGQYIEQDPDFSRFFNQIHGLLHIVLPRQIERKQVVMVAIGCTGGRHRSVYVTEKLGETMRSEGYEVTIRHRDIL